MRDFNDCPKCQRAMSLHWGWGNTNWYECDHCGYKPHNYIACTTRTDGEPRTEKRTASYAQWDRQTDDCILRMSKSADRIIAKCDYMIEQARKTKRIMKVTAITAMIFHGAIFAWALIRLLYI